MATRKRQALGKGLEALIRDASLSIPAKSDDNSTEKTPNGNIVEYISIDNIKPNSMQPRHSFDEESIESLAESINKHGLLQPVMLQKAKKGYELVAGERRWRAARKAGLEEIPAIVRDLTEEENALFAIIENVQREDLNAMEQANAYKKLMDSYGMTQQEVAENVGKSRATIANALRNLNLPTLLQEMLEDGSLSQGHANALGAIKDEAKLIEVAKQVVRENLSVRETEAIAQKISGKPAVKENKKKNNVSNKKTEEIRRIEDEMTTIFGTKVSLELKEKGGEIRIHFYSKDELDGLIDDIREKSMNGK